MTLIKLIVITSLWIIANTALANGLSFIKQGLPYANVKASLTNNGWMPLKNRHIDHSSLYAQEVYEQGMEEVVDCISMELDACVFRFIKNKQVLEIKTISRQLVVDSYQTKKR